MLLYKSVKEFKCYYLLKVDSMEKIWQNINIKKIEQNENVIELCKVSLLEKYVKYYLIKKNVKG